MMSPNSFSRKLRKHFFFKIIHDYFSGDPLLHFAIRMKDYSLLEILLDCSKFDLNEKNDDQLTILELIYLRDDSLALRMVLDKIRLERN